jgi:membrane protein YdbS with pleckstrin-like domain
MSGRWLPEEGVRSLEKYLVPEEERLVFVVRRHWVILAEPVGTTVLSGIVMIAISAGMAQKFPEFATFIFIAWLVVLGRGIYHVIEWYDAWFGATQRRLMLIHGLVTRKVAMMPLEKVTDMSYARSPLGQLLGYGEFVLESAGQDQALRSVDHIAEPDELYRILIGTMFGRKTAAKSIAAAKQQAAVSRPEAPKELPQPPDEPRPSHNPYPWQQQIDDFLDEAEPTVRLPPPEAEREAEPHPWDEEA